MVQRSGAAPRGSLHLMQAAILPWRAALGSAQARPGRPASAPADGVVVRLALLRGAPAEPGPAGDAAFIAQGQALAARGRRASLFAGEDLPPG
ncbi:hypothetical protein ACFFMP_18295 [Pseudoroseomonas cervicalis]|uniref:hypothetical protein n=1 Tax=Teichococcus cervicalis TaxID=204525 RepID=UPI0035EF2C83